jgi:hypothetical protein
MTLANMRQNGVRAVIATCAGCGGHKADVNVDALPKTIVAPRPAGIYGAASAEESGSIRDPPGIRSRSPRPARRRGT